MRLFCSGLVVIILTGSSAASHAADQLPAHCRGTFHLFRPAPRECLGPLETDRPHLTDTPQTVPAGHFALEAGLVTFAEGRGDSLPRSTQLFDLLFKIGLWRRIDLQVGYAAMLLERASSSYDLSAGDQLYLRLKLGLWGGDGLPLAFTVAPVFWVPLDGGVLEGGGMLLVGADLAWELELELNLAVFSREGEHGGRHAHWIPSLAITRPIRGRLDAFVELYGETWRETDLRWLGSFNFGLLWVIYRESLQLDGGVRIGLTERTPPYSLFLGFSFRI